MLYTRNEKLAAVGILLFIILLVAAALTALTFVVWNFGIAPMTGMPDATWVQSYLFVIALWCISFFFRR